MKDTLDGFRGHDSWYLKFSGSRFVISLEQIQKMAPREDQEAVSGGREDVISSSLTCSSAGLADAFTTVLFSCLTGNELLRDNFRACVNRVTWLKVERVTENIFRY